MTVSGKRKAGVASARAAVAEAPVTAVEAETATALIEGFRPYLAGMIETLGLASQPTKNQDGSITPGDLDAAKKVLDFMSKALSSTKGESRGKDILDGIAAIRNKSP